MSIHPLAGTHPKRTDPTQVLEELKRLALEQLGGLPGELYGTIEESLNRAAISTDEVAAPQVLYQSQAALWVLRQHHAAHVMRYRQEMAKGFDEFRSLGIRNRTELPLGLIDESKIDFHLAGQSLAMALDQRYMRPLQMMEGRLHSLTRALGIDALPNPLGPERLATAFIETFNGELVPEILRGQLFRHYERELSRILDSLYAKANTLLASSGYGVDEVPLAPPVKPARPIRPPVETFDPGVVDGVAESGSYMSSDQGPAMGWGSPHAAGATGHAHAWGHGHNGAPAGNAGGYSSASGGAASAGMHAQGAPAGYGTGTEAPHPQADTGPSPTELEELRKMLRAWREGVIRSDTVDPAHVPSSRLPPRRELRVEEVFSVASLLQPEPADAFARALAGAGSLAAVIREQLNDGSRRLGLDPDQIRFSLKEEDAIDLVALLFDSLFRSQPLQDRARRLYARLVLPYVKVALTDYSLFVQPDHPARRLFDAITEAVAGNRGETPQERELLDRAAAVSKRVVAEYNEDMAIFETAHAELDALLRQQRRRVELQAERAAKAAYGRERLGHARDQAAAVLARRLAAPPLVPAVAEFLSTTWRHHLVQTLLREGADSARYAEVVAIGDALVEADRIAAEGRGPDLARKLLALEPAIEACLASSGLDPSAAAHGLAMLVRGLAYPHAHRDLASPPPATQDEEDLQEKRLWLAGGTDTLRYSQDDAERLRDLSPGSWLQLTDMLGKTVEVKVAWVSPLTSRRLLVDRRGLRVLVASVEELAVLAGAGRLRTGSEPTPFAQAMQQVRRQLDRAIGRH